MAHIRKSVGVSKAFCKKDRSGYKKKQKYGNVSKLKLQRTVLKIKFITSKKAFKIMKFIKFLGRVNARIKTSSFYPFTFIRR